MASKYHPRIGVTSAQASRINTNKCLNKIKLPGHNHTSKVK